MIQQAAPQILIFGLGGGCAQSALKHLVKAIPKGIFTGWSRNPEKLPPDIRALCGEVLSGDLEKIHSKEIFEPFDLIVFTPPARFLPKILELSQCPLVALGSTRKFTKWPDAYALEVLKAESLLLKDNRPSFFLHPTMIFGNQDNHNLAKLGRIIRFSKILPFPSAHESFVQPIFYEDVGKALAEAAKLLLLKQVSSPRVLILAGSKIFSYGDLIQLLSKAQNLSRRFLMPVPLPCLLFMSFALQKMTPYFPKLAGVIPPPAAIRRLMENKSFSIQEMTEILGFSPRALNSANWSAEAVMKENNFYEKNGVNDGT